MNRINDYTSVFNRRANATAFINGSQMYSDIQGRVLFWQLLDGVIVRVEVFGLPQAAEPCEGPIFAIHIHEGSSCSGNQTDPFADTGMHYNPYDCPHPYHSGDLPPLFGVDGKAFSVFLTNRFTVDEILGKAIIIHSAPDDFTTQPSGDSGDKIACGIITPTAR